PLQLAARSALDAGHVDVSTGRAAAHGVGEHVRDMGGRGGDNRQVHPPAGRLVRAGAERGGRTGPLRVVVDEVDDDAPLGQGERGGRADEAGADDKCGSHWAMSLRRAAAAPRYTCAMSARGRSDSMCARTRTTRGMEPSMSDRKSVV